MINPQLLLVHMNIRCHVTALGCLKPPFVERETAQVGTLHFFLELVLSDAVITYLSTTQLECTSDAVIIIYNSQLKRKYL